MKQNNLYTYNKCTTNVQLKKSNTMTHLEQLELWWGEAADSFPGNFEEWLFERIMAGDSEDIDKDIECLVYELKINHTQHEK